MQFTRDARRRLYVKTRCVHWKLTYFVSGDFLRIVMVVVGRRGRRVRAEPGRLSGGPGSRRAEAPLAERVQLEHVRIAVHDFLCFSGVLLSP